MNLLTKIFIVFNLTLSVGFAYISLVNYAKNMDWIAENQRIVTEFNGYKANAEATIAENKHNIDLLEKQVTDLTVHNSELSGNYEGSLRENKSLAESNDKLEKRITTITTELSSLSNSLGELSKKYNDTLAERNAAVENAQKAETECGLAQHTAIEVSSELKQTEAELRDANKRINDMMTQILENRTMLAQIRDKVPNLDEILMDSSSPIHPLRGKVMRVEDSVDLVILSLGKTDEVKVGMRLVVSRGDEYIGKVVVQKIYDDMCSATIDKDVTRKRIHAGDVAQTL